MAIKIINDAPSPKVIRNTICLNCGVELQYTPQDVRGFSYSSYDGSSDMQFQIDCPKCHSTIIVSNPHRGGGY